ncbi:MAG TPA: NAD-dependent epimerase/dehydratase family protein [Methylomirabilota bacterium]|nr:NAD-dependent epimerase/dehydratase family protein [Methylomirabilota bacterium]
MRTLVTGGTGFTGSHLVRRLLERGHEVRVLDAARGLAHDELSRAGAQITLGSVTDAALVDRLVAGTDLVFHLAAAFRQINLPKRAYWEINAQGTRHIAEACLRHHVRRLVYCSTQGVHGHIKDVPGHEGSPIAPEDYYQQTKYEGEVALWEVARHGLEATVIRPMGIYGPGDPGRFLMLFRAVRRGRFLMFGDGEVFYHPCYIDNLVDAFELAAEGPKAVGETYLIGDDRYVSLNELVRETGASLGVDVKIVYLPYAPLWMASALCEAVCRPLGVEPPLFRRRAEWFRQTRAFSIDKARRELGFVPQVPLAEGLRRTAAWYRDHGYI